ncbi:MAG: 4Fe-4S dicluster domain-containing protein [Ruminococcaceae bacterium]|jgi:electron transport complex protein RnfB|nr:4Fe-4S dicluster domain-containing protein [Oscillospiraceae bacterium]
MADSAHPFGRKARALAVIDPVRCTGCGYCSMLCIMKCIPQQPDGLYQVDADLCIGCRSCLVNCPFGAVTMLPSQREA